MSSAQNQSPQSQRSASPSPTQPNRPERPSAAHAAETSSIPNSDSPNPMIPSASLTPIEVMPSTAPAPDDSTSSTEASSDRSAVAFRQQPIPPASEPMQYRAIGLIQGKYQASDEQFTRGELITEDGTAIGAVLLGRVMSLVKKHLDLEQSHLWVVYPRTRDKSDDLHMQVVGVWEPEKLAQGKSQLDAEAAPEPAPPPTDAPEPQDGYFSIRGEVLFYSPEEERLIVRIQQSPRAGSEQGRAFKLNLAGALPGNKSVGYFWDLQVQRQSNLLVVQEGTVIALVPPKKRKDKPPQDRRRSGGQGMPRRGPRMSRPSDRSSDRPTAPVRRDPIAKPVKRPKNESA